MGVTTFKQAIPHIEGRLYAYATLRTELPGAAVSNAWGEWTPPTQKHSSPQERYVLKYDNALMIASVVERVLPRLTPRDQRLIVARYFERRRWADVSRRTGIAYRDLFKARERILQIFYFAFGLDRE